MNIPKLYFRLLSFFLVGILLTFINTSVWANNKPITQTQKSTNPVELVESGQKYYNLGQFQSSIADLEQAVTIFSHQNDKLNQAITLSNLSLAYQQLGDWEKAEREIALSLKLLNYNPEQEINNFTLTEQNIIASSLNIYGRLLYEKGQTELALQYWQKTENIYQSLNNNSGMFTSKINQLQALERLGNYQQARDKFLEIKEKLAQAPIELQVQGLRSLGEILQAVGDFKNAEQNFQKSLELAKSTNSPQAINANLLSLGNTYWKLGKLEQERTFIYNSYDRLPWQCQISPLSSTAKEYYQKAATNYQQVINSQSNNTLKAQINLFNLLVESSEITQAKKIWDSINLNNVPPSQNNIYAKINLARHLACLQTQKSSNNFTEVEQILIQAQSEAKELADSRSLSYAYGNLGAFYEYLTLENTDNIQLLNKAKNLTEQALFYAQPSNAPIIAYQWQWQLGRIYDHLGKKSEAIFHYQDAVESLKNVRNDLIGITADVQFSFRDNVEPVYRQLVKLLLTLEDERPSQKTLQSALYLIDSLQLAELENFLSCDLETIVTTDPNFNESGKAAFIYPIILENRLNVIYQLPNQPLQYHINQVSRLEVEETVTELRKAIARRNPELFRANSSQIYQWLIKPLETYLQPNLDIDNLVFILDGSLRNIPMAVLYDSQHREYLIEKDYALAVLPTSQLFNFRPSSNRVTVLGAGISEALEVEERNFAPINAEAELKQIQQLANIEILLNSEFTKETLQKQLNQGNYSIVHLATHGNFSSDPQQTYLLAYGELLRANDINNLLRLGDRGENSAIDLLILSACQTASGDNRATLGLAGLAVRAGAESTLASLWRVSDEYTIPLITRFYENLNQGLSKAEALHQAQKSLIYTEINGEKYQNEPYDWGAYILVGNWK